jgi:hypothetical protein
MANSRVVVEGCAASKSLEGQRPFRERVHIRLPGAQAQDTPISHTRPRSLGFRSGPERADGDGLIRFQVPHVGALLQGSQQRGPKGLHLFLAVTCAGSPPTHPALCLRGLCVLTPPPNPMAGLAPPAILRAPPAPCPVTTVPAAGFWRNGRTSSEPAVAVSLALFG